MVEGLARLFCMYGEFPKDMKAKREEHHVIHLDGSARRKSSRDRRKIKSPILSYNKWEPPSANNHTRESPMQSRNTTPDRSPLHNVTMETEVKDIRRALRSFMNRINEKDSQARIIKEWRVVALVLDRLFFFIY